MTAERRIFVLWLAATEQMELSSDARHTYFLGKVTGLVEAYAEITGTTFVEASRALMQERGIESRTDKAA